MGYIDNKTTEPDDEHLKVITEFKEKGKLATPFFPLLTYDMVQSGYPRSDHGNMVARVWSGTNGDGNLLDGDGMWCKVSKVKELYGWKYPSNDDFPEEDGYYLCDLDDEIPTYEVLSFRKKEKKFSSGRTDGSEDMKPWKWTNIIQ